MRRFKKPYVGSRKIGELYAYTYGDDFVYFGKIFTEVDDYFVDEDQVVWVKNVDGFLVEKTL